MLKSNFRIACFIALQAVVAIASASTQTPTTSVAAIPTATAAPAVALTTTAVVTNAAAPSVPAPTPAAPESVVTIKNCTYANGLLGDANAPIRDFCLSQTTDISTGKAHRAIDFAMGYYVAMKCTAGNSVLDGSCKNAANTIANGVALAFHLDYTTLHEIRRAVPPGSTAGCPCSAAA